MHLTFLGTSSGAPTRTRNVTAQVLALDNGALILLDCGEATQHQLMRSGLRPSHIERILITHLHGDHIYGLPGLLACMAIHDRGEPVQLVGPSGLREYVQTVMRLSVCELPFSLEILEIPTGQEQTLSPRSGCSIAAYPITHRIPCFGYCIRENQRPGRFDPHKAAALGLPPGPWFRRLQLGEAVDMPDGRRIEPDQVCAPPRPGRVIVLLGDTNDASGIAEAARGCDLLVREVTYDASRTEKARQWGHSTSSMTGHFAAEVGARILIITHFSSRYTSVGGDDPAPGQSLAVTDLLIETSRECPETRVFAADDLWSFTIPQAEDELCIPGATAAPDAPGSATPPL